MIRFIVAFVFSFSIAQAASLKGDVIDTQIGLNDYTDRPTLCVSIIREANSGKLFGLVEDITDCFYTRQARRNPGQMLEVPANYLQKVSDQEMLHHLQAFDSQLEFLWSQAD